MRALPLIVALVASPSIAHAYCRATVSQAATPGGCALGGAFVNWSGVCTSVSLSALGTGIPEFPADVVRPLIAAAAARWRQAPCDAMASAVPYFDVHVIEDSSAPVGYMRSGPNANVISFRSDWPDDVRHPPTAIAITIVTRDALSGAMLDADMEFNTGGFQFTLNPAADRDRVDLESVLVHEFGHFLGLSHNRMLPSAVMYDALVAGETRRELNSDDVAGICDIYDPAEVPPDRACNVIPNGGFAATRTGGRVVGGCGAPATVAPAGRGGTSCTLAALAALGLAVALRARRPR